MGAVPVRWTALGESGLLICLVNLHSRTKMTDTPPPVPQMPDAATIRRNNAEVLDYFDRQVRTATTYTTVITGAGYAGLIAIWTGLRTSLDRVSVLATALLIGISLVSFIALELAKAAVAGRAVRRFEEITAAHYWDPDFFAYMREGQAQESKESQSVNRLWPYSFWLSAFTGVGAALWIMVAIIVGLLTR